MNAAGDREERDQRTKRPVERLPKSPAGWIDRRREAPPDRQRAHLGRIDVGDLFTRRAFGTGWPAMTKTNPCQQAAAEN
jgi:hypothetical protein